MLVVLYGCQVWSSGILREGDVVRPTLQTLHLDFKGTLGVLLALDTRAGGGAPVKESRLSTG